MECDYKGGLHLLIVAFVGLYTNLKGGHLKMKKQWKKCEVCHVDVESWKGRKCENLKHMHENLTIRICEC